ncbi:MAG: hypothetical protein KDI09_20050 [Halioglobus sp.]|nr:hypothetical protein [Halioglobus sp.]
MAMKTLLWRLLKLALLIEVGYLALINGALWLPWTQDLVNLVRPEKFAVRWESAWSPYPFKVYARGIDANGQSRSQQWQLRVERAEGRVAVLPLLLKRVQVWDVTVGSGEYRQRPRLKPDQDYSKRLPYFPTIEGRAIVPAETSPQKKRRPWRIALRDVRADGHFDLWIYNLRGSLKGSASAEMDYQTRGGALRLAVWDARLQLNPATVNGAATLFRGGRLNGSLAFAPFIPRENKGLRLLPHMDLDAELNLDVGSLRFINLFTGNLGDLFIDGAGRIDGRLRYSRGFMLAGTSLTASAADLSIALRRMSVAGQGTVNISTPRDSDNPLVLDIGYEALAVTRDGDASPFLSGDGLELVYSGSNFVAPDPDLAIKDLWNQEAARERRRDTTLKVLIDEATLLDVSIVNDYMPAGAGLAFTGGTAALQADVLLGVENAAGELLLAGENVGMRARGQDLRGDLEADLVIAGGVPQNLQFNLAGSSLTLDNVSVGGAEGSFEDELWSARLAFSRADAIIDRPPTFRGEATMAVSDTRPLVAVFENHSNPPGWIANLLDISDIEGTASFELTDNRLAVPTARAAGDKAELGAKAVFYENGRDGVIYARYRRLDLVMKMQGKDSNIDLFGAKEKFTDYRLPR